jgi:ribonucleoside-triphosphate reductase
VSAASTTSAGAQEHATRQGRDGSKIQGTNPCGEILLRNLEFCNLTEVVIREDDDEQTLANKVRLATIIGTWQSTLTDFTHLREQWRENCEEERLLGVSLTGIYGNRQYNNPNDAELPGRLARLRLVAHAVNEAEARRLNIPASAAITTVKPSGTVSQLTGVSSPASTRGIPRTTSAPCAPRTPTR